MRRVFIWGRSAVAVILFDSIITIGLVGSATAQDITIGNTTQVNNIPFTQYEVTPPNRYQQIYSASAFGSAVFIDAIRFSVRPAPGAGFATGEYLIRFSTTSRAVDGLSIDFDTNLGLDTQTFFMGMLSGGVRIVGTPFMYDPLLGNLLLDVTVVSQTRAFTGGFNYDQDAGDEMSRVAIYNAGADASPTADTGGLVTTFETRPVVATIPEPLSLALLATGLAGVAAVRIGRRRKVE